MDVNNLTIGQVKELQALLGGVAPETKRHPFVGRHVIARCGGAGVHAGVLVSAEGNSAILQDSRRLWRWKAKEGLALSGVARYGIDASESKLDTRVPEIALWGVVELIPTSAEAQESIDAA